MVKASDAFFSNRADVQALMSWLSHDPTAFTRDRTDHLEEQPEATRRSDEKGERSESERINVSLYRKNEILVEFESDRTG